MGYACVLILVNQDMAQSPPIPKTESSKPKIKVNQGGDVNKPTQTELPATTNLSLSTAHASKAKGISYTSTAATLQPSSAIEKGITY